MIIKYFFCKTIKFLIYKDYYTPVHKLLIKVLGKSYYYSFLSWVEAGCLKRVTIPSTCNEQNDEIYLMFDGRIDQAGLADNLRAAASVFELCKSSNRKFMLVFDYPFRLEKYLVPNNYNWLPNSLDRVYSKHTKDIVAVSYTFIFENDNTRLQHEYLTRLMKTKGAIRLYSNTFCHDESFYCNFHELFKLSDYMQNLINEQLLLLSNSFISVSLRFANLLGDLKDTYGKELSPLEKENLTDRCIKAIYEIHSQNSKKKVLMTSDSTSFIEKAQSKLDFIYVIPGKVGHVGHDGEDGVVTKTFLDLFVISKADCIYMVRSSLMYRSGFALRASMIGNKPFCEIII